MKPRRPEYVSGDLIMKRMHRACFDCCVEGKTFLSGAQLYILIKCVLSKFFVSLVI